MYKLAITIQTERENSGGLVVPDIDPTVLGVGVGVRPILAGWGLILAPLSSQMSCVQSSLPRI